jgi:hypothetical protein
LEGSAAKNNTRRLALAMGFSGPSRPLWAIALSLQWGLGFRNPAPTEQKLFSSILICYLGHLSNRRFKAPWKAERIRGGYVVKDGSGNALAYVYGRETRDQAETEGAHLGRSGACGEQHCEAAETANQKKLIISDPCAYLI